MYRACELKDQTYKKTRTLHFRIFFFFCSGPGERRRLPRRWPAGSVLIKNRGRGGGFSKEEAWEGEWRRGNVCGEGGGLNIFFRGRNAQECDWEAPISPYLASKSPAPPRSKPLRGLNRAIVAL